MKTYPEVRSAVDIVFIGGEVKTYEISAGSGIAPYLCEQSSQTGFLTLLDQTSRKSYNIPVANILEWSIVEKAGGE